MLNLEVKIIKDFGENAFCVQDYNGWRKDNHYLEVAPYDHIAIAYLQDDDGAILEDIASFIEMCYLGDIAIGVIEFDNLAKNNVEEFSENAKAIWHWTETLIRERYKGIFIDLESYETKIAFGNINFF